MIIPPWLADSSHEFADISRGPVNTSRTAMASAVSEKTVTAPAAKASDRMSAGATAWRSGQHEKREEDQRADDITGNQHQPGTNPVGQHPGGEAGGQVADAAGQGGEHGGERTAGQLHDEQGYGQDGKPVAEHGHGLAAEENPFPQHRFIICRLPAPVNASQRVPGLARARPPARPRDAAFISFQPRESGIHAVWSGAGEASVTKVRFRCVRLAKTLSGPPATSPLPSWRWLRAPGPVH